MPKKKMEAKKKTSKKIYKKENQIKEAKKVCFHEQNIPFYARKCRYERGALYGYPRILILSIIRLGIYNLTFRIRTLSF